MLLDPLRRGHVILLLEGSVEDGLAFEALALRDALDGGGQVRTFVKEVGRMLDAQRIAVRPERLGGASI